MKLSDWIENEMDNEELLPLCHTTRWKQFEEILKTAFLSIDFSRFPNPNPDNSPEDRIVYLFYGLPFYMYEIGDDEITNSEVAEDLPIGLIFRPKLADVVDRCYPFDTGASLSDTYKRILDIKGLNELKIYEVAITDGREMKKLVKRYFGSNENYCFGRTNGFVTPKSPKEENLLRLLKLGIKSKVDLRSRAVEVHSLKNIDIEQNLMAIIMPRLRSQAYGDIIEDIKNRYPSVIIEYYTDLIRYNSQLIRGSLIATTMNLYDREYPNIFSYRNIK